MYYKNLDVIIPTYNRAEYLKIALESLCESIASWRKTIVLNNASTDNTLDVIKEIQIKYPNRNIEIITNEKNIGNAGNFRRTQEIASNEYTAVFHDDDAIHPEYIDRAMKLISESDDDISMVSGGAIALYDVNHENWGMLPNSYWKYSSRENVFLQLILGRPVFCSAIYRTDIYKKIRYKYEKYGKLHDIIFMSEIGATGVTLFLHGETVRWRQHVGSDSNTLKTGPFPKEVIAILASLKTIYLKNCKRNSVFSKCKMLLFYTLLFNFSLFLYQWSDLERFLSWDEFKKQMINENIFNKIQYSMFNKIIDLILNPCIRKLAPRISKKNSYIYQYRVGI